MVAFSYEPAGYNYRFLEVGLDDCKYVLVDLLVFVRLERLELVECPVLLDGGRQALDTVQLLSQLEQVPQAGEDDQDGPRVARRQQVAVRLQDADALEQVDDLLGCAARRGVRDHPSGLLLHAVVARAQHFAYFLEDASLDDLVYLLRIAGRHVAHGPRGLLDDVGAAVVQQLLHVLHRAGREHGVRLRVVSGDDVANAAQRRHNYQVVVHAEQADEMRNAASVDDRLDAIALVVCHVADGPRGVG